MVKKNNPKKNWQDREKEGNQQQRINREQTKANNEYSQQIKEQQNAKFSQFEELKDEFYLNEDVIKQLENNVYKDIILNNLLSLNLQNEKSLDFSNLFFNQFSNQQQLKIHEHHATKPNFQNKIKILQFIKQRPLSLPLYIIENLRQNLKSCTKSYLLINLNLVLLQPLNLQYLNIYGPTGSGKTFTLKQIMYQYQLKEKVIWLNGMSITKGKTTRSISNLKQNFDRFLWQQFNLLSNTNHNTNQQLLNTIFTETQHKILIIDQFDQLENFSLADILRYAYIQMLKYLPQQKIYFISKIICVSNNLIGIFPIFSNKINCFTNFLINRTEKMSIQNIIFSPFKQKQAQQIIRLKIDQMNEKFEIYARNKTEKHYINYSQIFKSQIKGIFPVSKIKFVIKKISILQDIDIRKIIFFYINIFKQFLEDLKTFCEQQKQKNKKSLYLLNQQNYRDMCQSKLKRFKDYIISQKLIDSYFQKVNLIQNNDRIESQRWRQYDGLELYLRNLQQMGSKILRVIVQKAERRNKKKREDKKEENEKERRMEGQKQRKDKEKGKFRILKRDDTIQKDTCLVGEESKMKELREGWNEVKVLDVYCELRGSTHLQGIYPWLYQWQQLGLLTLSNNSSSKTSSYSSYSSLPTYSISVADNFTIQILNLDKVKNALSL